MESTPSYLVALAAAHLIIASPAFAQRAGKARPEFRIDAIGARAPTIQGGLGLAQPVGTYARLVGVIAMGVATHHGRSVAAWRADVATRFVLDPFGESHWALYGAGGVSVMYDEFDMWRPVVAAAIGMEGPPRGTVAPAFELGLGGGVRLGFVLRGVRGDRR
jgi:hypothetical protein